MEAVENNNKKRFSVSEDGKRIRARQGHSIKVDVQLKEITPPTHLYHGTAYKNLDSIYRKGLLPGTRLHVHLTDDPKTALNVGSRHGKPVVLTVLSGEMSELGHKFYLSENGVWLTDSVERKFLTEYEEQQ